MSQQSKKTLVVCVTVVLKVEIALVSLEFNLKLKICICHLVLTWKLVLQYPLMQIWVAEMLKNEAVYAAGGTRSCFLLSLGSLVQNGQRLWPCGASKRSVVVCFTFVADLDVQNFVGDVKPCACSEKAMVGIRSEWPCR